MGAGRINPALNEWIERRFRVPEHPEDKVRSLADAVAEGVRPGARGRNPPAREIGRRET